MAQQLVGLQTTIIGSLPKPENFKIPSCVNDGKYLNNVLKVYKDAIEQESPEVMRNELMLATKQIFYLQNRVGLDILTDGELRRDQYINDFCRRLNGFDFEKTVSLASRNGVSICDAPRIVSTVCNSDQIGFLGREWKWSQDLETSGNPIKVTVPGPMTIMDSCSNEFYNDDKALGKILAKCINTELKMLAKAGCLQMQIDDTVLLRQPERALQYGIDLITECFADIPKGVFKTLHACCGYPFYLDQTDYEKADKNAYFLLANKLDNSGIDALSIEDKHRRNDPQLFACFKKIKVVLGVIDVVKSRVETVEEIRDHIEEVLNFIPPERLIIAPDCGMIFLTSDLAERKLLNMVQAAKSFNV